jgi:hypothetical protein
MTMLIHTPLTPEYPFGRCSGAAASYAGRTGENDRIPLPTEYRTTIPTKIDKQEPPIRHD